MYIVRLNPDYRVVNKVADVIEGGVAGVAAVALVKGHAVFGGLTAIALLAGAGFGVTQRIAHAACVLATARKV